MVEAPTARGARRIRAAAETGLVTSTPVTGTPPRRAARSPCSTARRGAPLPRLPHRPTCRAVQLPRSRLPARLRRSARTDGLAEWEDSITRHTMLREDMKYLFEAFSRCPSMQVLASAVSALATYYPDALDPRRRGARLERQEAIAKSITMSAWAYKYSVHQPYVYPRNDVDYATNFLAMMFSIPPVDTKIDPTIAKALDLLFVLHADHEQNCSASTVRLVGSGGANLFGGLAGIHALSGPLHGGANQEVVEMLQEMHEVVATSPFRGKGKGPQRPVPADGVRPPGVQELRPARHDHQEDGARGPRPARRGRSAARPGDGAGAQGADRRVLRREEALPERRLLLGDHLPGAWLPHRDVPRALRHWADARWIACSASRPPTRHTRGSAAPARCTPGSSARLRPAV